MSPHDGAQNKRSRGPGLKKTGALPLVTARRFDLVQCVDYRWREIFEKADVMSEGAVRAESDCHVYYGSTSLLLPTEEAGGFIPKRDVAGVAVALAHNPHARVRAVRVACLEAQLRAGHALDRIRAELLVRGDARGVRVDVDVEARVLEEQKDQVTRHVGRSKS